MENSKKRQEILQTSLELIAENGFHGTSIAGIAQQAAVGAGTIYRYFPSKDVLINELYQQLHDKIHNALLDGYDVDTHLRVQFFHLGTALLRYFIANPLDLQYLEQYQSSPYGAALRQGWLLGNGLNEDLYSLLFEKGVGQQVIKDLPLEVLFALVIAPLLTACRMHIQGIIKLDNSLMMQTIQASWDGIKRYIKR